MTGSRIFSSQKYLAYIYIVFDLHYLLCVNKANVCLSVRFYHLYIMCPFYFILGLSTSCVEVFLRAALT